MSTKHVNPFLLLIPFLTTPMLLPTRALAAAATGGPYTEVCTNVSSNGGVLSAVCPDFFNKPIHINVPFSGIPCASVIAGYPKLVGAIWAVDGSLRCVYSHLGATPDKYVDIVSYAYAKGPRNAGTAIWRIDRPSPYVLSDRYPFITFYPKDSLVISAGGCVQTGGSGATWKSYVHPSGDNSNRLYSGLIQMPGPFPTPVRIASGIGTWVLPSLSPGDDTPVHPSLGYQDDAYSDNGYYSHDNGNNNQCLGIGPAWVEILETPAAPMDLLHATH